MHCKSKVHCCSWSTLVLVSRHMCHGTTCCRCRNRPSFHSPTICTCKKNSHCFISLFVSVFNITFLRGEWFHLLRSHESGAQVASHLLHIKSSSSGACPQQMHCSNFLRMTFILRKNMQHSYIARLQLCC